MRKIMFNDWYGLTDAVLDGRKTMTRRIISKDIAETLIIKGDAIFPDIPCEGLMEYSRYKVGEVVAVAQSYEAAGISFISPPDPQWGCTRDMPGYGNKMFVRADLMPHRIRITDIRVERLQGISDEDCMKEGIMEGEFMNTWDAFYYDEWGDVPNHITFKSPRKAFAALIDKVSGKGTWESNPYVWVYSFGLIK